MRLLYISAGTSVTNPEAGDEVRAWNIIQGLNELGWNITVFEQPGGDLDVNEADVYPFRHVLPPRLNDANPFLVGKLLSYFYNQSPDVVHVKTFAGVTVTKVVAGLFGSDTTVVYDAQNFETEKIETASEVLPWYKRFVAPHLVPALESLSVRAADHVVSVSEADKESFQSVLDVPEEKISVVPSGSNPVDSDEADVSSFLSRHNLPKNKPLAVFHGYYDYYPNEEAIETIVEKITPELNDRAIEYHFVLAGKGVPNFSEDEGVTGVGYVEDLDAYLAAADLAVVPLQQGGGTKLKMLDYLCSGVPPVTTEIGAEGLDLRDGESALIYDDVDEAFVDGIVEVIEDEELRKRLGCSAQELGEEKYHWDSIVPKVDSLYRSLASN